MMLNKHFRIKTTSGSSINVEGSRVTRTNPRGVTKVVTDGPKRGRLMEYGACFCKANVKTGRSGEMLIPTAEEWGALIDANTVRAFDVVEGMCVYFKYASGLTYVCTPVVSLMDGAEQRR